MMGIFLVLMAHIVSVLGSICKVAVPAIRKWKWKSMELEVEREQSLIITCLIHVWQSDLLNDQWFWAPFRICRKKWSNK